MSRSRKKHPSCGHVCYFSNKKDRTIANKRLRKINKQIIATNDDLDNVSFKQLREVSDTYSFSSDGLVGMQDPHQSIQDWAMDGYRWENRGTWPTTTLKEAERNRNWNLLKHYISK